MRGTRFAAGDPVGRSGRSIGRALGRPFASIGRGVRRITHAHGAGESGLGKLIELHAVNSAGDMMITVALASTVFFSVPTDEARGRVALYLAITLAPFALLAPVIGPLLDRVPHGRRAAMAAAMLIRALLALTMAHVIAGGGLELYPAALGVLVASKAYGVVRSAVVPRLLPPRFSLVKANSRVTLGGLLATGLAAPIGAGLHQIGPSWPLYGACAVFTLGTMLCFTLPHKVDSAKGEARAHVIAHPPHLLAHGHTDGARDTDASPVRNASRPAVGGAAGAVEAAEAVRTVEAVEPVETVAGAVEPAVVAVTQPSRPGQPTSAGTASTAGTAAGPGSAGTASAGPASGAGAAEPRTEVDQPSAAQQRAGAEQPTGPGHPAEAEQPTEAAQPSAADQPTGSTNEERAAPAPEQPEPAGATSGAHQVTAYDARSGAWGEEPVKRPGLRNVGSSVLYAWPANATMRTLSGFLTLFLAFMLREHPLNGLSPELSLGIVAVSAGAGNALGTAIGAGLRARGPELIIVAVLTTALGTAITAAVLYSQLAVAALAAVAGLSQALSKLSLDALIQRDVPENVRTSAFARSETALQMSWVVGGAVGIALPLNSVAGMSVAVCILSLGWLGTARGLLSSARRGTPHPRVA
ncbi:MFS transporter [Streptomyces sp. HSW2009]|uniref:MFS transporter n=1 Tax=Streptomyces sp. HSW2009 TaxID=3142890 RepID=UPI0032EB5DF3